MPGWSGVLATGALAGAGGEGGVSLDGDGSTVSKLAGGMAATSADRPDSVFAGSPGVDFVPGRFQMKTVTRITKDRSTASPKRASRFSGSRMRAGAAGSCSCARAYSSSPGSPGVLSASPSTSGRSCAGSWACARRCPAPSALGSGFPSDQSVWDIARRPSISRCGPGGWKRVPRASR
jgi:hypothetical protein